MRRGHWTRRAGLAALAGAVIASGFARHARGDEEGCWAYALMTGTGSVDGTLTLEDEEPQSTEGVVTMTTVEKWYEEATLVTWKDDLHEYNLTFSPLSTGDGSAEEAWTELCLDGNTGPEGSCVPGDPACPPLCETGPAALDIESTLSCSGGRCYRTQVGTLRLGGLPSSMFSGTLSFVLVESVTKSHCQGSSTHSPSCDGNGLKGCGGPIDLSDQ